MVLSLLKSLNLKQRNIGITTAMLVDFFKIKENNFKENKKYFNSFIKK